MSSWEDSVTLLPYVTVLLAPVAIGLDAPLAALIVLPISFLVVLRSFGGLIWLPLVIVHILEFGSAVMMILNRS